MNEPISDIRPTAVRRTGIIPVTVLSLLLLFVFYGKLFTHINSTYFGSGGDGLQSYYGALYHVKYDTSYMRIQGMNYPYGEMVFYGGAFQPFIANSIKFISANIADISAYTIAIINLAMLFSIIVCAIALYLLFTELKIPPLHSTMLALGIAFLSPQIARFIGHYSLTYMFAVPLTFLWLIRFHNKPTIRISIYFFLLLFILSGMHLYYFGMLGAIIIFYWVVMMITDKNYRRSGFLAKHLLFQLVLPYLAIQSMAWIFDTVTDRTNNPWGYLHYVASWESVFLPVGKPFGNFISNKLFPIRQVEYEGVAFVGISAACFFFFMLIMIAIRLIRGGVRSALQVTDNLLLNIFFWVGFLTLLFSFGLPFIIPGLENLLDYLGPIRQMRSVGRFTWIFFYAINIIAYYSLFHSAKKISNSFIKAFLLYVPLFILFTDAYFMNKGWAGNLDNKIAVLEDRNNDLPENKWLRSIDIKKYQAILPLPYYHNGSENIWIEPSSNIHQDFLVASLKTGLPVTAVHLNRVSLSQTYTNLSAVFEPYRPLEILKDYPDHRPLLLIADLNALNENEKNLVSKSKWLAHTPGYDAYELSFDVLHTIADSLGVMARVKMDHSALFKQDDILSTDSVRNFVYVDYNDQHADLVYQGKGAYQSAINNENVIYDGIVPYMPGKNLYHVNFWLADIRKDLYARTGFRIDFFDPSGKIYFSDENVVFRCLRTFDGPWALFERDFAIDKPTRIRITLKNHVPFGKDIYIDELLIRPTNTDLFRLHDHMIFLNDRFYPL